MCCEGSSTDIRLHGRRPLLLDRFEAHHKIASKRRHFPVGQKVGQNSHALQKHQV